MIVRETETFEPSTEIEHDGVKHTVARDLGDSVEATAWRSGYRDAARLSLTVIGNGVSFLPGG